ncbi:hypothetical protein [Hylemonella gracilis]|uniref:Uncharacterized protein n=1 Tax=Hylemonella gracilis ATCC 19624 TaxID=887062 RepID=F3KUN9_9BURK|nr:hypothetical protein [Hylemonella gracilis]EGI76519.1 hypothetical protein HGR_10867 [Hylemonella gracilis ATCC 19624]
MGIFTAAVISSVLSLISGDSMTVVCVEDGVRSQGEVRATSITPPLVEQPFGITAQDELTL